MEKTGQIIAMLYGEVCGREELEDEGKNHQQILAQLYEHLKKPMGKIDRKFAQTFPNMDEEHPSGEQLQHDEAEVAEEEEGMENYEGENENGEEGFQEQGEEGEEEGMEDMDEENMDQMDERLMDDGIEDEDEEDIGLYGEELDEEQMESYEHEKISGEEQQFQYHPDAGGEDDENDQAIDDNFDHFREVELQNTQPANQLHQQIQNLESKVLQKKNWVLQGEVSAKDRPVNSLLEYDLQFKSGLKYNQQITQQNNQQLEQIIKQRIIDQVFDDRVRYVNAPNLREHFSSLNDVSTKKSQKGLAQLYELDFKDYLGMGEKKEDKLKKEIMDGFKQLNYYLDSLSNLKFTPKPSQTERTGKVQEAVITEEKIPITMWEGEQPSGKTSVNFRSEKEQDNKAKRSKNKRISRLKKKKQDRKKMNKIIQYGGMTKYEAEVRKKISKNKQQGSNTKYSKSSSFFQKMNQRSTSKPLKPNPNLSKLKI